MKSDDARVVRAVCAIGAIVAAVILTTQMCYTWWVRPTDGWGNLCGTMLFVLAFVLTVYAIITEGECR